MALGTDLTLEYWKVFICGETVSKRRCLLHLTCTGTDHTNKEARFLGRLGLWGGWDLTEEKEGGEILSLGCEKGPPVFCSLARVWFIEFIVYNLD